VRQSGLNWAIARTVLVFGISPGLSRTNIVLWVKESLEQGKTIQVVNDQFRTPTLAEDLAEGCLLIAEKGAEGVFNISGPDFLTPYEMAIETADFFDLDKSLIQETDSTRFVQPAKRPLRTGFIIEKARKELGFEPKTFRAAIGILAKQIILASS
ncbi:MAG: sugar nucleotide-binding protein, partial [Cyclobacteriaceae bacterium]|nr:sugar nucleotide-binding protein [Cyclobacteriaceae bacterium]